MLGCDLHSNKQAFRRTTGIHASNILGIIQITIMSTKVKEILNDVRRTYVYMPGIHVTVISLYVTILRALISYYLVLFQLYS